MPVSLPRLALLALLSGCATGPAPWLAAAEAPDADDGAAADDAADATDPSDDPAGDTGAAEDSGAPAAASEPCPTDADGRLPVGTEGAFLGRDAPLSAARPACAAAWHATAGAAGSTLEVRLDAHDAGASWVWAEDLTGAVLAGPVALSPGEALPVDLARSGELFVGLEPVTPGAVDDPAAAYTLSAACVAGCDRAYTRYPLVFLHGMAGTDTYLGILDYWFGAEAAFGETTFVTAMPAVDALAGIDARAQQWSAHLDALEDAGLGRRFNLVGHSQGGLDARLLAAAYDPDGRVASVTTVSAPHRGTVLADLAHGVLDLTPFDGWLIDAALEAVAGLVGLSGPALSDQLRDMTRENMATFNAEVPDRADVAYWSWAGVTCRGWDWACQRAREGEIVSPVFSASFRLLLLVEGDNDGVVSLDSARWGTFLGELPADHMDEVGQIAGSTTPAFDAAAFYVDEARRLHAAGL